MQSLGEVLGISIPSLLKAVMCPTMFISNMNSYLPKLLLSRCKIESPCIHTKNQELSAQGEGKSAYSNHQQPAR